MKLIDALFFGYFVGKTVMKTPEPKADPVVMIIPKFADPTSNTEVVTFHVGEIVYGAENNLPTMERPAIDFYIASNWLDVRH